ncbi:hypothetical protein HMPREF1584_01240 [Gardnerella vaginalis JCP8481A]|nr:hypothetical protein HMPREF1584_01240 [Gardnerella vaginalis JCP8481A]EPI43042.1 hypothetical protein HMPREF1585_00594 [Gardnerella vaginalis JCP8481B]
MRVLLRAETLIAWLITKNSVGCAVFALASVMRLRCLLRRCAFVLCASIPLSSAQRSLLFPYGFVC